MGLLVGINGFTYCIPLTSAKYRNLLLKEYRFLGSYKNHILAKAQQLYERQKETNIVKSCYVTFDKVEKAYNDKFDKDAAV